MLELPDDFPHKPPKGYSYKVKPFKRNLVSIWLQHPDHYNYSDDRVYTIWGFYDTKKRCYRAPINASKQGDTVDVTKTRAWTAMPLLKLALDSADPPPKPSILSFIPSDTP